MEGGDTNLDILLPVEQPLEYKSDLDSILAAVFLFDIDTFALLDVQRAP